MPRIVAVIPARMASRRLPGKPLRQLWGVPMIEHVYRRVRLCPQLSAIAVATPDEEIAALCHSRGIPVERTGEHVSGTDRVAEVSRRLPADMFVNVQGDQPLFEPGQMEALLEVFVRQPQAQVATVVAPLRAERRRSPHTVKVAVSADGRALYFSRAMIPDADAAAATRWQHVGVYGYTPAALETFRTLGESPLERAERLEQLRFLEAGIPIHLGFTELVTPSVDTLADARRVERRLALASRTNGARG